MCVYCTALIRFIPIHPRTCCRQSHFYFRPRFIFLSQSTLESHWIGGKNKSFVRLLFCR